MQDSRNDDSASAIVDAEGPGPQTTGAPEAAKPFKPTSEMSDAEWEYWGREANKLYPKIGKRYG